MPSTWAISEIGMTRQCRTSFCFPVMVGKNDIPALLQPFASWSNLNHAVGLLTRQAGDGLGFNRGTRLIMGNGLVGRLLYDLRRLAVEIRYQIALKDLVKIDDEQRRPAHGLPWTGPAIGRRRSQGTLRCRHRGRLDLPWNVSRTGDDDRAGLGLRLAGGQGRRRCPGQLALAAARSSVPSRPSFGRPLSHGLLRSATRGCGCSFPTRFKNARRKCSRHSETASLITQAGLFASKIQESRGRAIETRSMRLLVLIAFLGGRAPMVDVRILCGSAADMFVVVDGVKIARRGYLGTSQAGTWVSLEPGWEVVDDGRRNTIAIKHNGVSVH
jgi:hypothetical protein